MNSRKEAFLVTGIAAFLSALVFAVFGVKISSVIYSLFAMILVFISYSDIKRCLIPGNLLFLILLIGCLSVILKMTDPREAFASVIMPGTVFLAVYLLSEGKKIGGGDVKLVLCAGIFLGIHKMVFAALFGCILFIFSFPIIRKRYERRSCPFGPFICVGIYLSVLAG